MTQLSRRTFLRGGGIAVIAALGGQLLDGCTSPAPSRRLPSASAERTGPIPFPREFQWGVATSAYQVEGAAREDGKGPSVWDTFSHHNGTVADGSTGDVAADHYHRYAEDIALMSLLHIRSYRFSISWPRVLPEGAGTVNQKGLDFYKKLVDALSERGIRPVPTLWHWDTPQALQDKGGWENRDTAAHFADYAAVMHRALGDAVPLWLTINEPKTVVQAGYLAGAHAPGIRDAHAAYAAAHHMLLGHGMAAQSLKAERASTRVGAVLNLTPVYPNAASNAAALSVARLRDGYENRLYLDPVLKGSYPDDVREHLRGQGIDLESLTQDSDLKTIASGADILGVNYYNPTIVDSRGNDVQRYPTSQASWQQIYPAGLRDILLQVKKDYGDVPISITENGIPTTETPDGDGAVNDLERISFVRDHLRALHEAMADGVAVEGYHLWSLLDNFEWAQGYTQRWGITYVDFTTQKRTPKRSASWYAGVIGSNAVA
jgi:beta-glucosidase